MIDLEADIAKRMQGLKRAMQAGADGKILKRELSKRLRGVLDPLVQEQKSRVLRLPSKGHSGPSMRQAIARQIKAGTRWSGNNTGVQVVQKARGMPRDFRMAGRMFNREDGWNPQTLGGEVQHQEVSPANWFDQPTEGARPEVTREVHAALVAAAAKIGQQAR